MVWSAGPRTLVVATLLMVGGCAPAAEGDWLQPGGDGMGTGQAQGDGPAYRDVALSLDIPGAAGCGSCNDVPRPLIVADSIFALVVTDLGGIASRVTSTLFEIPLDTGLPVERASVSSPQRDVAWLTSDGTWVFIVTQQEAHGYSLETRRLEWTTPLRPHEEISPSLPPGAEILNAALEQAVRQSCGPPAVHNGTLLIACIWRLGVVPDLVPYVVGLRNSTGALVAGPYESRFGPLSHQEFMADPQALASYWADQAAFGQNSPALAVVRGVATDGRYVTVAIDVPIRTSTAIEEAPDYGLWRLWVIDMAASDAPLEGQWVFDEDTDQVSQGTNFLSAPTIVGPDVLIAHNVVHRFRLARADPIADHQESNNLRDGQSLEFDQGAGLSVAGGHLVAGIAHRLYRLDPNLFPMWRYDLDSGQRWQPQGLVSAGETVYGVSAGSNELSTIHGVNAQTGEPVWDFPMDRGRRVGIAVSDGVMAIQGVWGNIVVLGRLPLSIQPEVERTEAYPQPGEVVRVDLGETGPGAFGPATEFRAEWGDGEVDNWQAGPVFRHVYSDAGDMEARFTARNAQNQTSSEAMTFFVGQYPPGQRFWNDPLDERYQEQFYFVLGLLATAIIALVGFYRVGRKRRRLDHELRDLEAEYKRLVDDPASCDSMLSEKKAKARSLFLQKKLEEAHSNFLERRIDELRQGLRVSAVDEKLKFLPHGMVQHLRRLLHDGKIDAWERSHFLDALERETTLNKTQRQQVRSLVEGWFARDAQTR